MQVQGWLDGDRGGEFSIVGLDSTLSPLEHPLKGWGGSAQTITHPNLIMQMSTSKSNTL